MRLTLWTYEGPPHVGSMRIATSMRDVHYVIHAPQGDTYADLLFTMIERQGRRPPVTYTTFQARDLGGDTAELVKNTVAEAAERHKPDLMFVGESCTAELLQDQPATLAQSMLQQTSVSSTARPIPVVPLELPAYSRKENWGASETFYHLIRKVLGSVDANSVRRSSTPTVNLLGPSVLGFRSRDNVLEVTRLLSEIGVQINVCAPLNAGVSDIERIPAAHANLCLYPEVAETTCRWLERRFGQPSIGVVPIGVGATREFVEAVAKALELPQVQPAFESRLPWYSRSVDSTYLTGKRVFVFGDATHAVASARIASEELAFDVVGLGTYSREQARSVREAARKYGLDALITDDYLAVESAIRDAAPELVLGTQMERHTAKRLGIPCAVISAPFHVQDCPARYSPTMGFEGANVLFDSWVHPLMMGLEEHLLRMFQNDFEFRNGADPSHLALHAASAAEPDREAPATADEQEQVHAPQSSFATAEAHALNWHSEALAELKKIPFFVRGKARSNTERFALEHGFSEITVETLYDAKAFFSR
ncbi:MAG: ferredoxin:protochlorophyllide reductase (ATP-dependent) subunit B [Pseudomonadota bacterium]